MIQVTKTYLPPLEEYIGYLNGIWERAYLTNDGPLARQLEDGLKAMVGTKHLSFCTNGTIVLQIALKMLDIKGEVLTTPFSYVATTNFLLWENCEPVFVDIDPKTYCIDPTLIEAAITDRTTAIVATHVYGNACDVVEIERIAKKHNLFVIYDGAHAFGSRLNGQSLLSFGDISTCSFHATKLFHTVEGGMLATNRDDWEHKMKFMRAFGHKGDEYYFMGINGKNSEFHAAMGLCNLPRVPDLIAARKIICDLYDTTLNLNKLTRPELVTGLDYNYAYYPVVFESEAKLLEVRDHLVEHDITPRRYFYPSLNTLHFLKNQQSCPVSEDIASRVACLPLHAALPHQDVVRIAELVNERL
jgi:dTDP-4-amino-4,6-dideoxygalactose transaminase